VFLSRSKEGSVQPTGADIELMKILAETLKFNIHFRWTYVQWPHKNGSYRVNTPAYEVYSLVLSRTNHPQS
jgi:hypothetical protein